MIVLVRDLLLSFTKHPSCTHYKKACEEQEPRQTAVKLIEKTKQSSKSIARFPDDSKGL